MAELQSNCSVTAKLVTVEDAVLEVNNDILSGAHSPFTYSFVIHPTSQSIKQLIKQSASNLLSMFKEPRHGFAPENV